MENPNEDSPLNCDAANLIRLKEREAYEGMGRMYAREFAISKKDYLEAIKKDMQWFFVYGWFYLIGMDVCTKREKSLSVGFYWLFILLELFEIDLINDRIFCADYCVLVPYYNIFMTLYIIFLSFYCIGWSTDLIVNATDYILISLYFIFLTFHQIFISFQFILYSFNLVHHTLHLIAKPFHKILFPEHKIASPNNLIPNTLC